MSRKEKYISKDINERIPIPIKDDVVSQQFVLNNSGCYLELTHEDGSISKIGYLTDE